MQWQQGSEGGCVYLIEVSTNLNEVSQYLLLVCVVTISTVLVPCRIYLRFDIQANKIYKSNVIKLVLFQTITGKFAMIDIITKFKLRST